MIKPSLWRTMASGLLSLLLSNAMHAGRPAQWLVYKTGDFLFDFSVDQKTETIFVKNTDFFSGSPFDQYGYAQGTWDFTTHTRFGDYLKSKLTLRNKVRWGTTRSVVTTASTLKLLDISINEHSHGLSLLVPWIRKAWVKVCLNNALDITSDSKHYLKFGAFPFEVGRGISLGSAYAVSPGLLGFYADNSINQYAFGAQLHGDVTTSYVMKYDVYAALLQNLATNIRQTTEPVYAQWYRCGSTLRGPGVIDWALAGRLKFVPFERKNWGRLGLEPYVVYYYDPTTKVEFEASSSVKLGTFGFAVEFDGSRFEIGLDTAFNVGHQAVKAWDRNQIIAQRNATTAAVTEVYSNVFVGEKNATGSNNAPVTTAYKTIVDNAPCGTNFNGQQIGTSGLYNGPARFRPAYRNLFCGNMFVMDAAYWLRPEEIKLAATVGYASGDEDPNLVLNNACDTEMTKKYSGFIPLQEIYSGKRVRSIFVIGSHSSSLGRPMTAPYQTVDSTRQRYAACTTNFTNIIYTGGGLTWTPQGYKRFVKLNPNILYYWQDAPAHAYCLRTCCLGSSDAETSQTLCGCFARRSLGLEVNLFAEAHLLDNFRAILATAVFVPGGRYADAIGQPLTTQQYQEVTRASRAGIDHNAYPLLNKKTAFAIDFGLEYLF